ncbi:MAG: hypothetical protein R3C17_18465 [Planctomycetaceae bacterium]
MPRLFKRLFAFLVLLGLCLGAAYLITGYAAGNHRLATWRLKHQRLAALTGPRIILVGGSNLHYGMDSELLQSTLQYDVVNMGIQGGLGLRFMLAEIASSIRSDDVVILLAEPALFSRIPLDGESTLYELVSKVPEAAQFLTARQLLAGYRFLGPTISENWNYVSLLVLMRLYGRPTILEETNVFGDYEGHRDRKSSLRPSQAEPPGDEMSPAALDLIEGFQNSVEQQGGRFLVGFAPLAESYANFPALRVLEDQVPPHLRLGKIINSVLPDSCFYDTPHHLLFEQRGPRTRQLIADLRAAGVQTRPQK